MSKTTSSPLPISRSPGSACGRAPFSPAAMIGGKEGSAPSSRILASQARATSRSVRPARPRSIAQRKTLVGELGGGGHPLDLLGLLHGAELLDEVARRDAARRPRRRAASSRASCRTLSLASSKPTLPDIRAAICGTSSRSASGRSHSSPTSALGALGVAEVGEEDPLVAADQAGAVGPREAGQVADVRQVGDEELVELALGDQLDEAVRPAHTPSLLRDQLQRLPVAVRALAVDLADEHVQALEHGVPAPLLALARCRRCGPPRSGPRSDSRASRIAQE